jgi:hypothetical protein
MKSGEWAGFHKYILARPGHGFNVRNDLINRAFVPRSYVARDVPWGIVLAKPSGSQSGGSMFQVFVGIAEMLKETNEAGVQSLLPRWLSLDGSDANLVRTITNALR